MGPTGKAPVCGIRVLVIDFRDKCPFAASFMVQPAQPGAKDLLEAQPDLILRNATWAAW